MKDQDVHSHIENAERENKEILFQRVSDSLVFSKKETKLKPKIKRKTVYALLSAVSLCLAIVVVILVLINNKPNTPNNIRYYNSIDCVHQESDYTIKDYNQNSNMDLLYLNWYDTSDEIVTTLYIDKNKEYVAIEENFIDLIKDVSVSVYITDLFTEIDFLAEKIIKCEQKVTVKNVTIEYFNDSPSRSFAVFQFDNNKYYVLVQSLTQSLYDEDLLINIVKDIIR